ncbi:carbohydrate ABC transporter permease [Metamycoplasma arthritidis]|nr:carbohydrate ABC transporter permease [Metamycoplasma arthritidis]
MGQPIDNAHIGSVILTWSFKIFVLVLFGLIVIFPFYFMLSQSLVDKTWQTSPSTSDAVLWFPLKHPNGNGRAFHWENFRDAFTSGYFESLIFTAFITAISVVARIFFSITFGYAFSIRKWRFKRASWLLFLSLLVLPEIALLSGQYKVVSSIHWNQYPSLIIGLMMPFVASVFSGFMYRNAFEAIPDSVRESAMIDGASGFKFFVRVAVPMVKATTWTVAILTALASWNSYTWALAIAGEKGDGGKGVVMNVWLTTTGRYQVPGDETTRVLLSLRMAATVLAIAPMLVVYFLLRSRIMNAISRQGRAAKG